MKPIGHSAMVKNSNFSKLLNKSIINFSTFYMGLTKIVPDQESVEIEVKYQQGLHR